MRTIRSLINRLGYLSILTLAFFACSEKEGYEPSVLGETVFEVDDIVFESAKGEQGTSFSFKAGNEWVAAFSDGGNVFFNATPTKGEAGDVTITVKPLRDNTEVQMRTFELRVSVVGETEPHVVKVSQFGKDANIQVSSEQLELKADASGEYFIDTLTVNSDQNWELANATSGILFNTIEEKTSGQILTKKIEVKVGFKDFTELKFEGSFDIIASHKTVHIGVDAIAECRLYQDAEMSVALTDLELLLDSAATGVYKASMYIYSNVQWKIEKLPSWLETPKPSNITESGTLERNPSYVEINIVEGMIPSKETNDVIILSDVHSKEIISVPIHFAGIDGDYINHTFEFPRYDKYGNDFSFDPLSGSDKITELSFMMETAKDYGNINSAPFKLLMCKSVNGILKREEVSWATLRMGDSSKDKVLNGVYTKELYLTAKNRGDEDDTKGSTIIGQEREAYIFLVPASVSFDDLFEDATSELLKSKYIGSLITQKNAFLDYKMTVTGIENGDTINVASKGETLTYNMLSDAVKISTSKLDITDIVNNIDNPRTFIPKDVTIEFKLIDGIPDLTKFVLAVGKNKDGIDRVIKIVFNAFRGINPDGTENSYTMFTFYIKQPK